MTAPKDRHLSSLMSILAHSHQDSNRRTRPLADDRLLAKIRASSAYCNQLHCWCRCLPQKYPICLYPGDSRSLINELKQRLNSSGEQGSPCSTPLLTRIMSVNFPRDETVTPKSESILLNIWMKVSGTWWYLRLLLLRSRWTSPKAFRKSNRTAKYPR